MFFKCFNRHTDRQRDTQTNRQERDIKDPSYTVVRPLFDSITSGLFKVGVSQGRESVLPTASNSY